MDYKERQKI